MILYRWLPIALCTVLLSATAVSAQDDATDASKLRERRATLERVLPAERTVQQRLSLGQAYYQAGRLDDAFQEADAVLKRRPDIAEAWLIRGDVWRERGKWPEALAAFDRAARIKPGQAEIELRRGQALLALGKTREADLAFGRYQALRQTKPIRPTGK